MAPMTMLNAASDNAIGIHALGCLSVESMFGVYRKAIYNTKQSATAVRLKVDTPDAYLPRGTAGGSVRHGVGFHFAPSGSFLNCVLRYSGCVRFAGSSRIDDTMSHTSPLG